MDPLPQLQAALSNTVTIERELGGGGMSRVFPATARALGRQIVIKVLPEEMSGQLSDAYAPPRTVMSEAFGAHLKRNHLAEHVK